MQFTIDIVNNDEFLLGFEERNLVLCSALCTFTDAIRSDSEISEKSLAEVRGILEGILGYKPNVVNVVLPVGANGCPVTCLRRVLDRLQETIRYALITYYSTDIPDLYIGISINETEEEIFKTSSLQEFARVDNFIIVKGV